MLKKIFILAIPLPLVAFFFYHYSITPDLSQIILSLTSSSLASTGHLLDTSSFSLLSTTLGQLQFNLPSLILAPLSLLHLLTPLSLYLLSAFLLAFSLFLLFHNIFTPHFSFNYFLYPLLSLPFFLLSFLSFPFILTLLFLSLFTVTKPPLLKSIFAFLGAFSSPFGFIFFPLLLLYHFFASGKTSFRLTSFLALLLILFLSRHYLTLFRSTFLPLTLPLTHGFFTDIHRQADLNTHVPLLGKIFYNKYSVTLFALLDQAFSYLDWDRYIFYSVTPKFATLQLHRYFYLSLFELPLILHGLYLAFKKRSPLLSVAIFAFIAAIPLTMPTDPILLFIFCLIFIELYSLASLPKKLSLSLLIIIFSTRFLLLNFTLPQLNLPIFRAYQELTSTLQQQNLNHDPLVLTDRLGQPHLYLTYFDLIPLTDLQANLNPNLPHDSQGYLQPPVINNFTFASFTYTVQSDVVKNNLDSILIEFEPFFLASQPEDRTYIPLTIDVPINYKNELQPAHLMILK